MPPRSSTAPAVEQGKTVLVVEDDPSTRLFLSLAIELEGFAVDLAASGAEALRQGRADPPDAILLDWLMPGMGGQDFLRAWRADPACPDVPVVVMTASSGWERTEEPGIDHFLRKPFDIEVLLGTLANVLYPASRP